jgi:hypothetical protein
MISILWQTFYRRLELSRSSAEIKTGGDVTQRTLRGR